MKPKKEYPVGWHCPRCDSINSPQKDKCQCKKIQAEETTTEDTKQLLQE